MLHTRCQVVLTRLKLQSNRHVSSLSPLGTAFNSKPQKTSFIPNQIRDVWKSKEQKQKDIGLFQIPGLTRPEAFQELEEECERRCHSLVEEACTSEADGRRRLVSRVFDELSDELCQVADMVRSHEMAFSLSLKFNSFEFCRLNSLGSLIQPVKLLKQQKKCAYPSVDWSKN